MSELKAGDYLVHETVEFPAVHPGQDWHAKVHNLEAEHSKTRAKVAHVSQRVDNLENRFTAFEDRFENLDKSIADIKRHLMILVNNQLVTHQSFARQDNAQKLGVLLAVLAGAVSGLFAGIISTIAIKFLH